MPWASLRTYAEYLGLSGDELVEEYKTWRELQGSRTLSEEPPVGVFRRAKELQTDTGIFQLSGKDKRQAPAPPQVKPGNCRAANYRGGLDRVSTA